MRPKYLGPRWSLKPSRVAARTCNLAFQLNSEGNIKAEKEKWTKAMKTDLV